MNEKKAIALCLKNFDPIGFEFLFKTFRREAYFHALSFLDNHDDASEACQECFSKAFRVMPGLKKLDKFYPWFYTILRNHCMNILRKRTLASGYISSETELVQNSPVKKPDFIKEESELQFKTRKTMEELSPEFREILRLKYYDRFSYDKISDLLKIPKGTVMSRLYYSWKSFKTVYSSLLTGYTIPL